MQSTSQLTLDRTLMANPDPQDSGAYKVRMWQHRLPMANVFGAQGQEHPLVTENISLQDGMFGQLSLAEPSVLVASQNGNAIMEQQAWQGYVQENWNDRRTVPADLSKFRSPSNVRGAPVEMEPTPTRYAGWQAHDRMATMESMASTNWNPSFADTYSIVDPLRRDSESVLPMSAMHISHMSSPTKAGSRLGHAKRWSMGAMQPPPTTLFDPYSYQPPQQYLQTQTYYGDVSNSTSTVPAFGMNAHPDSRRASTATSASSAPLISPQDFLYHSSAPVIHSDPSSRGFLGGARRGSSYCDYFSLDPHDIAAYTIPPPPTVCLPLDLFQPALMVPSFAVDTVPKQPVPANLPTGTTLKRARLQSVGDLTQNTRSHARSTLGQGTNSSHSLRIPSTLLEDAASDCKSDLSRPAAYRRLSSPVASIRPTSTDTEGGGLLDEDESGEEGEDADGERERESPATDDGEYLPVPVQERAPVRQQLHPQPSQLLPQLLPSTFYTGVQTGAATPSVLNDWSAPLPTFSLPSGPSQTDQTGPRKQKLRSADDMYTPLWARGAATAKEGLCDMCPAPGRWLQLKNSAFWYHKQFTHGVSSVSGTYFAPPLELRRNEENGNMEGLCHQCNVWTTYSTRRQDANGGEMPPTLWYKHAHKCHCYVTKGKTATFQRTTKPASKKRRSESME